MKIDDQLNGGCVGSVQSKRDFYTTNYREEQMKCGITKKGYIITNVTYTILDVMINFIVLKLYKKNKI
jgi:hypothetical protein